MKKASKIFMKALLFLVLIPLVASLPIMFITGFGLNSIWVTIIGIPVVMLVIYLLIKSFSKLNQDYYKLGMYVNGVALLVLAIVFTIMMLFAQGNIKSELMLNFIWITFPFFPATVSQLIMDNVETVYLTPFSSYILGFIFCAIVSKTCKLKQIIIPILCIALCAGSSSYLYVNNPALKYKGHGFDYMNGYSSTDFNNYTVYAKNSKLVTLDHKPSLIIENEKDMPILDGAEACYPLYSAFAKAVYKDIDVIEKDYFDNENQDYPNGKIVTFTNTISAFYRLVSVDDDQENKIDMLFGARPSQDQLMYAEECGVEIEVTPIGREAFVFFVEEDNPISDLTSEQIKKIYHGDITNWNQLGGTDQSIMAFQRPNDSGSQTMMTYFMGDVSLKEPKQYETVSAMEGVIKEVAQYNNEDGAIGYTFRYFLEGLNQEKGVKMLSVNGVYPTLDSIEDDTYPLTVDLCLITRKNDSNLNVQKMKEFILSEDGQYIVHQTGYGRLSDKLL